MSDVVFLISEYATTEIKKTTSDNQVVITVAPRMGSFDGMLDSRKVSVVLDGFFAPSKVTVNDIEVPYSRFASYDRKDGKQVWGYDGNQLQTLIWLSQMPADEEIEIICTCEGEPSSDLMNGKKGLINRIMAMTPEAKLRFSELRISDFQLPIEFMNIAQCGSYVTEDPFNARMYLEAMDVKAMIDNVDSWEKLSSDFKQKVAAQSAFER